MAHILLAGCGKLGEALGTLLQQQGHQVTGIRRSKVEMPFPCLQMDLTQPESIHLPQQVDYVVYTTTPSERSDQGYQQAYVNAQTHLLDALQDKPVKHFFFVSSTAVYHQNDGSWVDENSPTQPLAFNGKRVLEGEQLAGSPKAGKQRTGQGNRYQSADTMAVEIVRYLILIGNEVEPSVMDGQIANQHKGGEGQPAGTVDHVRSAPPPTPVDRPDRHC